MLVIMFAGGAFHILTKTGALHAVVAKMAKIFSTRVYLFLPILTLVFGLICTTQGVNLFIAFAPIMVMMAFAMGLDSITGASIILLGGAIGFSTGPLNINTTIVLRKSPVCRCIPAWDTALSALLCSMLSRTSTSSATH